MLRLKNFLVEGIGAEILARLVRDEAVMPTTYAEAPDRVPEGATGATVHYVGDDPANCYNGR